MSFDSHFFALIDGRPDGARYRQSVHDLGDLVLPSGRLEASDPFIELGSGPAFEVSPGIYPVRVTVADVSDEQDGSHLREAYLSVILGDGEVAVVDALTPIGEEPPEGDDLYGVSVDTATVAFADAEAVGRCMPNGNWYEDLFDNDTETSWFALMDSPEHLLAGCANIVMPGATSGENVVLAHSGWGDGFYPVLGTFDAAGGLLGVHIDLVVARTDADE